MYRLRPECRQEEEDLSSTAATSGTDLSTTTTKTVTTISGDQDDKATTIIIKDEEKMVSTTRSTASSSQKDDGLDYEDIFGGEGTERPYSSSAPTESIIVLQPTVSPPSHCSHQRSVQQRVMDGRISCFAFTWL